MDALSPEGPPMPHTFLLLNLLRSELHHLELLRRLEVRLKVSPADEKARIQREIDRSMDQVAHLSKRIQKLKASPVLSHQS